MADQATQTRNSQTLKLWRDPATGRSRWAKTKAAAAKLLGVSSTELEPVSEWRDKPRAASKTKQLSIRVSEAELQRIRARAEAAGLTLTEWVVKRCG